MLHAALQAASRNLDRENRRLHVIAQSRVNTLASSETHNERRAARIILALAKRHGLPTRQVMESRELNSARRFYTVTGELI